MRLPRNAQRWLPGYLQSRLKALGRGPAAGTTIDLLFCVADHYEPDWGGADARTQSRRVSRWLAEYPRFARHFRDADGFPPQHTFFSPQETYQADQMSGLAELCRHGYGEVEVHLHHGHDTSANLRTRLEWFKEVLAGRHGLLGRDRSGRPGYAFIHGNWALDNGRLDDRFCGVNDELTILRETGCYADFTMPAAPDPAQSRTVNAIYYAVDDPDRPRSYDHGTPVRERRPQAPGTLLMVQGPLTLRWSQRAYGLLPRIDNAAIDASPGHHPTLDRFRRWVDARVCVEGRPEWVFIKVHTHGAKDANADVLLGEPMYRFHEALAARFNDGRRYRLHYVTAREMVNIVKAAEQGERGNAGCFRDYLFAGHPHRRRLHLVATPSAEAAPTAPRAVVGGVEAR